MLRTVGVRALLALVAVAGSSAIAQNVISAKSGLIHYVEGDVFIGDKAVEMKYSVFPNLKDDEVLRTSEGRAEVLLTPGMFLRLAENSSVRMVSSKLTDTKVQILTGVVLLETAELFPEYPITLMYKDKTVTFKKTGLIGIDADHGTLRVYSGEASVEKGGELMSVKQAKLVNLDDAVMLASKFDNKTTDEFFRWAARRASYLSIANVASAKSLYDSGTRNMAFSSWAWNPWYGMFTYMPYRGSYMSPFGYGFWSPGQIVNIAYPNYGGGYYNGGGYTNPNTGAANSFAGRYDSSLGYNVASRGANMSSPSYNAPATSGASSAPAASAPAPSARGGDSGGDRGSSAGGGRGR